MTIVKVYTVTCLYDANLPNSRHKQLYIYTYKFHDTAPSHDRLLLRYIRKRQSESIARKSPAPRIGVDRERTHLHYSVVVADSARVLTEENKRMNVLETAWRTTTSQKRQRIL